MMAKSDAKFVTITGFQNFTVVDSSESLAVMSTAGLECWVQANWHFVVGAAYWIESQANNPS
jgi:hypothetical protein